MSNYTTTTNTETIGNFQLLLDNMSVEEFETAQKLWQNKMDKVLADRISEVERKQEMTDVKVDLLNSDVNGIKKRQEKTEDKMNNLHQPENKRYLDAIKSRVWFRASAILGDITSAENTLFHWYLYKAIYGGIKKKFALADWRNLSVKDAEDPNSVFQRVCKYIESWFPTRNEVLRWINELIQKRDFGRLSQERCRALTEYLSTHDINDISKPLLP